MKRRRGGNKNRKVGIEEIGKERKSRDREEKTGREQGEIKEGTRRKEK